MDMHAIARIALFRDENIAVHHPELAVHSHAHPDVPWRENGKLVWTDSSNPQVQDYNIALAKMVGASGADEIQFDYVRFPSDGDISIMRFPGPHPQSKNNTVPTFLRYARSQLHPLGVRLSADVFGLSASHDLGIGQLPSKIGGSSTRSTR